MFRFSLSLCTCVCTVVDLTICYFCIVHLDGAMPVICSESCKFYLLVVSITTASVYHNQCVQDNMVVYTIGSVLCNLLVLCTRSLQLHGTFNGRESI